MTHRTNLQSRAVLIGSGAVVWMVLMLAGCSGGGAGGGSGSGGGGAPGAPFAGSVDGGGPQNPIGGSTVTLYAMGSSGSGSGAASLVSAVSDSTGGFSLGSYTCPVGNPQTYIIATGGDAGGGVNSAIGLMALMGPCNSLTSATFVTINELTTAAGAWALAQFTDSTGQNLGATSTNATGLTNAVNLAESDLVVSFMLSGGNKDNTGIVAPFWADSGATDDNCTGGAPATNCDGLEQMNTIANIAAACVNSAGPSSTLPTCASAASACDILFACTGTPSTGTTLQATHAMATIPAMNVAQIFAAQGAPPTAPFTPFKSSAPNAWTLALNYTGGGLNVPFDLAIDAFGNAWVVNQAGSVTELDSAGSPVAGSPFAGGSLNTPEGIAIDASGNIWVANFLNRFIAKLNSSGIVVGGLVGGGLQGSQGIAIDPSGNVWATNIFSNPGSLSEFTSAGTPLSPSTGYIGGGMGVLGPLGIAIDASGNAWATNSTFSGSSVTKLDPTGVPLSPPSGFIDGGVDVPEDIAIDASGNAWVANQGGSVTELTSSGSAVLGSPFTGGGLIQPFGIAIDASGNVWVTNLSSNSVTELNSSGSPMSPDIGFTGGGLDGSQGIAIDASGDVWVTNTSGSGSVTELIGSAGPVTTPLAASFAFCNKTVCSP